MLIRADARHLPLVDGCVQTVVTSPPYFGQRRYEDARQIGVEQTPAEFIASLVAVFREVRRVLRDDGTVWLNLGDSYQNAKGQAGGVDPKSRARRHGLRPQDSAQPGLKPKDLIGIPWAVAFALRDDGWFLRRDIIWAKGLSFCPQFVGSVMPEAAKDRPSTSHEYVFLLSKKRQYYYDAEAIKEPASLALATQVQQGYNGSATKDYAAGGAQNPSTVKARIIANRRNRGANPRGKTGVNLKAAVNHAGSRQNASFSAAVKDLVDYRNARSVWVIPTQQYGDDHFATFPEDLVEPCVLAGSRHGDLVFDPFIGTATVGAVCERFGRRWVGTDLSYQHLAKKRTAQRGLRLELGA
jgi:DNA modification methylase